MKNGGIVRIRGSWVRKIKKRSIEAEVQVAAGLMEFPTRPKTKRSHSKEKDFFADREDAFSNSGGSEEDKAISVLPKKHLADENTPFRF